MRQACEGATQALVRAANVSPVLAQLLALRDVSPEAANDYLNPTLKRLLPEPSSLKDMNVAVARTRAAIASGERIAVFGDYDVDGSCSAALLNEFFTSIGRPPRIYIPDRLTEGYGPSAPALLKLKAEGAGLVITVDCGAAAVPALRAAGDAGLDVIVLDHHAIESAPPAFAQVNPNQPGDSSKLGYLCAAGVVFLFAVALNRSLRDSGWYTANGVAEPDLRESVDLVGLATVCDVVPLLGINRAFVRAALAKISALRRPGIKALVDVAKAETPFTPYHLGFVLGPRINAGGRVGRCNLGAELLAASGEADCAALALQLDRHNRERQTIEAIIIEQALALADVQHAAPFVLVAGEGWHAGVVGIIASRLKERFGKPALVVGFENGVGRGSARSIAGVDIGALIRAARQQGILENGGGHAMAAGFSIAAEKLEALRDFLSGKLATAHEAGAVSDDLMLDTLISASGATADLAEEIGRAGPFGSGNAEPVLVVPDVRLAYADVVGKNHVRLRLEGADGGRLSAIAFRAASTALGEGLLGARGSRIHVAGTLRAERWNGERRVQLQLEDASSAAP